MSKPEIMPFQLKKIALLRGTTLITLSCLCFFLLPSSQCQQDAASSKTPRVLATDTLPYQINSPSLTINLVSEDLREISGLSPTEEAGVFLAIADERGEIFFIDGSGGGAIYSRILFRDKGDFEGVEKVDKKIYALKSDGDIFEISKWKNSPPYVQVFDTPLRKQDDVEGLGYDPARKSLLLACKGDPERDTLRGIFAFSIEKNEMTPQPLYTIDPLEVNRLVPYDSDDKNDRFFSPSGIAVHPKTQDVYVISTALKRLLVLNHETGKIRCAIRLDKKVVPQPEGIAFDAEGNLYLSSEGKKGEGLLLRFDFRK